MDRLAIVSDSHIPGRADAVPDPFEERLRDADWAFHAGDFTASETLDRVRDLVDGDFLGVRGNMDRGLDLPRVATVTIERVTFVLTHGTGSTAGYEERVARTVRAEAGEEAVGVSGHTHEVLDTTVDGVRLLNPGSVTGAAPADRATMMSVEVEDGDLSVTVHEH